jgi:hypothetical protein
MPWNGTTLYLSGLDEAGNTTELLSIAGGVSESVFQPEWSPDGRAIFFVSDRSNWWNLYRFDLVSRTPEPLAPMAAEFGLPLWRLGASTYACAGSDRIVCAYSTGGLGQLAVFDLKDKVLRPFETPFTEFSSVRADGFLSLAGSGRNKVFTDRPHLTLGVRAHAVEAMVTIPNAVNRDIRRKLKALGDDKFQVLTDRIVKNMKPLLRKCPGAAPWFRGVQRRYKTQRSIPLIDAEINFDLRTAVPKSGPPKPQPQWLKAAYASFARKKGSNYQIQLGVVFRYDRCPELARPGAIDLVAASWLACKPLIDLARI